MENLPDKTPNQKYGLTEIFQHDLNGAEVCRKCGDHVSKLKLKACPVIGAEEVARFRNED